MSLLGIRDLTVAFDEVPLLDCVCLSAERGERICLVGRNGTGKTTLFKTIVGDFTSYSGEISRERGAVFSYLPQEVPADLNGLVFDVVAGGHKVAGNLLAEYHSVSLRMAEDKNPALLERLSELHHELELNGGWNMTREVDLVISHMNLDPNARCEDMSAGMKRRVLLARALVSKPDLLLLDEPTNHLDIDSIEWLEKYLRDLGGAIFFITHDRAFSKKLATRIVEIDRGKLTSWTGDFDAYTIRKTAELEAEEKQRAKFDKKLAEEEAWLRKGVRARRTRNEGRVNDLLKLREEKRNQRQRIGSVHLEAEEAERSGKLVLEVENAAFSYAEKNIISDFSTTIMRGDKIGIIGPNGSGKTTLLRVLLGDLKLANGYVKFGTNLQVAYFDQLRMQLAEDKNVQENICDGNPFFMINGRRRHVIGYLEDFLFTPDRAKSPVSVLSGGERNRLMLAKLFTIPSNVLVLDEPTNDLDSDTLDLLEEMLLQYSGTVLLVSHDREFLNNVVTSTIVLEGNGKVEEFVGGYDDWVRQRKTVGPVLDEKIEEQVKVKKIKTEGARKLSFKEKNELSELPKRIDELEKEKEDLFHSMADSKVYESSGGVAAATARISEIEEELKTAYDRWAELEERKEI